MTRLLRIPAQHVLPRTPCARAAVDAKFARAPARIPAAADRGSKEALQTLARPELFRLGW